MCGFANPISFRSITDNHIRSVENFMKEKCLDILQKRLSDSFGGDCEVLVAENEMHDHFGMYADDVKSFEFQAGDILLIKGLVDHVNKIVNEKGLEYFRKRLGKKQKMTATKRMKKITEFNDENDLKFQLMQKMKALFASANRLNDVNFDVEKINDNLVNVYIKNENQIYGEIVCMACNGDSTKASKPKKIIYNVDGNGNGCWVMSNFKKHLERAHHLIIENIRPKKMNAKSLSSDTTIIDQIGLHCTDNKIDANGNDTGQSEIKNVSDDDDASASVLITNDDDLQRIEEADTDTQTILFNQISKQMSDVLAAALNNNESQEEMNIVLCKSPRKITVVKVPKDNNCVFGALAHQLWMNQLSSRSQKTAAKKLRAEVVEHILKPENFAMFQHDLQDYIYELKKPEEITDLATECKLYVRHKLSKDKVWGGAEVLLAVSSIYSTNVILFYEDGSCQKIKAAGKNYERSIAVAYRFDYSKENMNHYDSVCEINSDDLLAAVRKMAKRK